MGRGRAKAKQTKVARELKYRSFDTDFGSLERELRAKTGADESDSIPEAYADLADKYATDEYGTDEYGSDGSQAEEYDGQYADYGREDEYSDLRQSG